jgi:hypothetical protein
MAIVVITDSGTFKAFRLDQDAMSSTPRLWPVENYKSPLGDDRVTRLVTDSAGQNTKGSVAGAAINDGATGERHNICLENDRRSISQIADTISDLLASNEVDGCLFAASDEINSSILEQLTPSARGKIEQNLHCNLVNSPKQEVLKQFHLIQ